MTVTYTTKVSNTSFCGFSKLLFRWRGSVFKLLAADLLVYFLLYFSVAAIYRFALRENEKRVFEKIAITCEYFRNVFPISFVLGFYVTIVVQRWWEQYMLIPWPDTVCIMAATYIEGQDERGRMLRRSFARYINLAFALAFSRISPRVARRLSTYQKYIDAGYMTQDERVIFEMMDACSQHHKIWMPLVWASFIVRQARREGRCPDDHGQKAVVTEITNLRYNCGKLQEYHTMSVPLVYTQVVTLATYSYFAFSILGRQFLDPAQGYENHSVDFYVPIFTLFQFVFYVGWLKVAESLLNPFGDDDDDFETTEFLDRHLEVSYMIVDNMHKLYPDVLHPPGSKDLAAPLNNVLARPRPVDSPPSKAASLSGQSEGEKSPVVKSLSQCCIQWRRRASRCSRASPIRHNGDAYLDTYGAAKTPPVLHGISGRPGSPKCSATEQPFLVPSKDIQVTVHTPL
ncbi:bestrophin-2-like isoform X2 [Portunus trituberculatus]|uniref:bestrophin-2-like isoform X2 n=1 Tax=Portunus trituberculatus TaxID=210409 RepID=UPI001E1CBB79|nr:bestrophin-2-like isoform X2 [Portunus trituberculatus]